MDGKASLGVSRGRTNHVSAYRTNGSALVLTVDRSYSAYVTSVAFTSSDAKDITNDLRIVRFLLLLRM